MLTAEFFCVRWRIPLPPMTSSTARLQPCCRQEERSENGPCRLTEVTEVTAHHQLTAEDLLVVADEVVEGLKELDHALVLLQGGVLLKRLLDQLPQLLGLGRIRKTCQPLTFNI